MPGSGPIVMIGLPSMVMSTSPPQLLTQHAHLADVREAGEKLARHLVHDRQVPALGVGIVVVEVAAVDEAALVGLRDVHMAARRR